MTAHDAAATRFVLVRHGEASGNRELRYLGSSDVPLTPRGQEQARRLAAALRPLPLRAIYSSPLARARSTAEAIAAETGLPVEVANDLRESDFGTWEQLTRAEVLTRDGAALAAWEAGEDIAPGGGESFTVMQARAVAWAEAVSERHSGETVVLVSHVGPIKALICHTLGLPPAGALRMWLDPASISMIEWRFDGGRRVDGLLRAFNAVAHLDAGFDEHRNTLVR